MHNRRRTRFIQRKEKKKYRRKTWLGTKDSSHDWSNDVNWPNNDDFKTSCLWHLNNIFVQRLNDVLLTLWDVINTSLKRLKMSSSVCDIRPSFWHLFHVILVTCRSFFGHFWSVNDQKMTLRPNEVSLTWDALSKLKHFIHRSTWTRRSPSQSILKKKKYILLRRDTK